MNLDDFFVMVYTDFHESCGFHQIRSQFVICFYGQLLQSFFFYDCISSNLREQSFFHIPIKTCLMVVTTYDDNFTIIFS